MNFLKTRPIALGKFHVFKNISIHLTYFSTQNHACMSSFSDRNILFCHFIPTASPTLTQLTVRYLPLTPSSHRWLIPVFHHSVEMFCYSDSYWIMRRLLVWSYVLLTHRNAPLSGNLRRWWWPELTGERIRRIARGNEEFLKEVEPAPDDLDTVNPWFKGQVKILCPRDSKLVSHSVFLFKFYWGAWLPVLTHVLTPRPLAAVTPTEELIVVHSSTHHNLDSFSRGQVRYFYHSAIPLSCSYVSIISGRPRPWQLGDSAVLTCRETICCSSWAHFPVSLL